MENAASSELISSWQQRILAGVYTDPPFKAKLPFRHDVNEKIFKTLLYWLMLSVSWIDTAWLL